jgi:hypothetical protein
VPRAPQFTDLRHGVRKTRARDEDFHPCGSGATGMPARFSHARTASCEAGGRPPPHAVPTPHVCAGARAVKEEIGENGDHRARVGRPPRRGARRLLQRRRRPHDARSDRRHDGYFAGAAATSSTSTAAAASSTTAASSASDAALSDAGSESRSRSTAATSPTAARARSAAATFAPASAPDTPDVISRLSCSFRRVDRAR